MAAAGLWWLLCPISKQVSMFLPFEFCAFKCSSLCSTISVPFTMSLLQVCGEYMLVHVFSWLSQGLCFSLLFMQVLVLRDQGDVLEIESVVRLGWNNIMTVGMCIPVCFTLKLQSGIEKRMLITLASGVILYMCLQMHFCPLHTQIYIKYSLYLCFIKPRSLIAMSLDLCFCLPFPSTFKIFLLWSK